MLVYELGHGQLSASLTHSWSTCPGTTRPCAFQWAASVAKIGAPDEGGVLSQVTCAGRCVIVVTQS